MIKSFAERLVLVALKHGRRPIRWNISGALWSELCSEARPDLVMATGSHEMKRELFGYPVEIKSNVQVGMVIETEQDV